MQLTINMNELTTQKRTELFALLGLIGEKSTDITSPDVQEEYLQALKDSLVQKRDNLILDHLNNAAEKPKRTRRTKAEMENSAEDNANGSKTDENNSDDSEPTPTRIEAPEAPESKITLNDLKEKAQDLVRKVDRDSVKKAINQFADKLSDVKPSDFQALMSAFNMLG